MKYKLLMRSGESNHQVTCICGKCDNSVYISESMREEFKTLMGWDETEFIKRTVVVEER